MANRSLESKSASAPEELGKLALDLVLIFFAIHLANEFFTNLLGTGFQPPPKDVISLPPRKNL